MTEWAAHERPEHHVMMALILAAAMAAAPALPAGTDPAWLTRAERTDYAETARYDEILEYCRRLDHASDWIRTTRIGVSPEGRDLILVIASKRKLFDAGGGAALRASPVVLIQAGIHAGEIEGKDAGLMLLRDIAITRSGEPRCWTTPSFCSCRSTTWMATSASGRTTASTRTARRRWGGARRRAT